MSQKMGLNSVTTVQGESVTPHSSIILDCAMHSICGMGESVVASSILNQTAATKLLYIWHIMKAGDAIYDISQ